MEHTMSPTAVAVLLLLALLIDYMSVGSTNLRDKIAFLLALPALREGFNGSALDAWTVDTVDTVVSSALEMTGGAYIAGASVRVIMGVLIFCVAVYAIGALVPNRWESKLGKLASLQFPRSEMRRINTKLWYCAIVLALFADLAPGWMGGAINGSIDFLAEMGALLPNLLFGVS